MVYDPLGSANRATQPYDYSTDPGFADITPSPRELSFNGGPYRVPTVLPPPNAGTYQPTAVGQPGVGKFNLALGAPAPWVAHEPGVLLPPQHISTPGSNLSQVQAPGTGPQTPPVVLGGQAEGPVEMTLRGLEMIPGQLLPGWLNEHINNLFGLVGSLPDTLLRQVKPLSFLPSGQDVPSAYGGMADTPEKRAYNAAIAADPVNASHYMAQYLRMFEKDYASSTGRNRLFSAADLPSESLSEQLSRIIFGALGAGNSAVRRTYVGSKERDVAGTVLRADPANLPGGVKGDLAIMRQSYLDGKITLDQLYDDIATSRWAWTQDPGLFGTVAGFGLDVLTDPLTLASLGLGTAAKVTETGVVARRAAAAAHLLENTDPAAYGRLAGSVGRDNIKIAQAMEQSHPALLQQATDELGANNKALLSIQPLLVKATEIANRAQNPLSWFGGDHIGGVIQGHVVRQSLGGVADALGAHNIQRIAALAMDKGSDNPVARALGVYHANIVSALHQRNLTREIIRSNETNFDGTANQRVWARRQVPTMTSEAHDMAREKLPLWLPSGRTGREAVGTFMAGARDWAAKALVDLTGATPEEAAKIAATADPAMLGAIHALNYGRAVDGFKHVKDDYLAQAQRELASATTDTERTAAQSRLDFANRLTLISERHLTVERAKALQKDLNSSTAEVAARHAIEQYDIIAHNFKGAELAPDALISNMKLLVKQLLQGEDRLVRTIDPATIRHAGLNDFFGREKATYGDKGYELALAPKDIWGVVKDQQGFNVAAHPWVDVVNDAGHNWLPSKMDRVRLGMFTSIRGNRLLWEAKRRFVTAAVSGDGAGYSLTVGEAEALFGALRDEGARRMVGPRGLSPETIWQVAAEVKIPAGVRQRIGERGLAKLFVQAWEGELKSTGWSSKFTGQLKTSFAKRGNFVGRVAEEFYPRARFYLSPMFLAQEMLEGPFFNIIRGHKPGMMGKWTDRDIAALNAMDSLNTHERYTDQFEYIFFNRVLTGETKRASSGRLGFLTNRIDGTSIRDIKLRNYAKQWVGEASIKFEDAIKSIQPGLYETMQSHYTDILGHVPDKQEIMLQYLAERGLGRGEDARMGAHMMDMTKPPDLGKGHYILQGDLARTHGYDTVAAMREDIRGGRYSRADFDKVMLAHSAHPDYTNAAWERFNRPGVKEFHQLLVNELALRGKMSKTEARKGIDLVMRQFAEHAKAVGTSPDEYIAHRFPTVGSFLDWRARRDAALHKIKVATPQDAVHEAFHLFAEELEPSAKATLVSEFNASLKPRARRATEFNAKVEEWAAQRFEEFSRNPDAVTNPNLVQNFNAYAEYAKTVLGLDKPTPHPPLPGIAIPVRVGATPGALARYAGGEVTLGPSFLGGDMAIHNFVHEIGHGFEGLFDTKLTDASFTKGLGRYDADKGKFVVDRPFPNEYRNPSEAAADAFASYVLDGHEANIYPLTDAQRGWVEARLAEHPEWRGAIEKLRKDPDPAAYVAAGKFEVPAKVGTPGISEGTAAVFNGVLQRDHGPARLFNADEERVWESARIALLREEDQAHKTHFYARGRTWLERSLNHPYFGLYPLSYMWGKVVPEMVRFLVQKPFGLKAPFGGLLMAKDVWQSTQLQLQTDENLRKWVDGHQQTIQFLSLLVPGTPWETPVNMPVIYRRALQTYVANQQHVAAGEPTDTFDAGAAFDDMMSYSVGLTHARQQIGDILDEFLGQKTDPTAPKVDLSTILH